MTRFLLCLCFLSIIFFIYYIRILPLYSILVPLLFCIPLFQQRFIRVYKTIHSKLKIEQHKLHQKTRGELRCPAKLNGTALY